jgi:hypothetical protein
MQAESSKKIQNDMLLSCAANNARAFMWTNNLKDHITANFYLGYSHAYGNGNKTKRELYNLIAD